MPSAKLEGEARVKVLWQKPEGVEKVLGSPGRVSCGLRGPWMGSWMGVTFEGHVKCPGGALGVHWKVPWRVRAARTFTATCAGQRSMNSTEAGPFSADLRTSIGIAAPTSPKRLFSAKVTLLAR